MAPDLGVPYPRILHLVESGNAESADAESEDPEGQLHYTISVKGLEHLWILVSAGGHETNSPRAYLYTHYTVCDPFLSVSVACTFKCGGH